MKFADLFSGIGGFNLAAQEVLGNSATCVGHSEIDPVGNALYEMAFADSKKTPQGDIRNLISGKKDEWELPKFELCFAGFPCQPYSNVGKRNGLNDERSWVFFDLVRALQHYRPKYFIFENVEKITSMEKGAVLRGLIKHLEDLNYKVDIFKLNACDYGLPQQRKRIFFCGRLKSKSKLILPLPAPKVIDLKNAKYPTTWHLLEREMPARHIVPEGSRKTIFTKNEKWMGDLEIDRAIARPICASMGKWHRANQDNYFTEHYIFSKHGEKHPDFNYKVHGVRRVTPLEALRMQGFPDKFDKYMEKLSISPTPAYRLIGNAVPVNLTVAVLKSLMEDV